MMYAGGDGFALINARLQIQVVAYNENVGRDELEVLWKQKYDEALVITEDQGRGYSKRKHATIDITDQDIKYDG